MAPSSLVLLLLLALPLSLAAPCPSTCGLDGPKPLEAIYCPSVTTFSKVASPQACASNCSANGYSFWEFDANPSNGAYYKNCYCCPQCSSRGSNPNPLSWFGLATACPTDSSRTCPSACGLTNATFDAIQSSELDTFSGTASASACVARCMAGGYLYWEYDSNPSNRYSYKNCYCYRSCSYRDRGPFTGGYSGLVASCASPFVPTCPSTCSSAGNGVFGLDISSPARIGPKFSAQTPAACAAQCATLGAPYFQLAQGASTSAFSIKDCYCFATCLSSSFVSYAPQAFVVGATCQCAGVSCGPQQAAAQLPVTCVPGRKVSGVTQYNCSLCNNGNSLVQNVALACPNFAPLSLKGVTPGCTVLGSIDPGSCSNFWFKSALVPGRITALGGPGSTVTIKPPLTVGTAVDIRACQMTGGRKYFPNVFFAWNCTIANTAAAPVRNIILSCTNFEPSSAQNINPDCTISKVLAPKEVSFFSFVTMAADVTFAVKTYSSP